jgi:hypothetical protein
VLFYSFLFGIGIGTAYTAPMVAGEGCALGRSVVAASSDIRGPVGCAGWKWFPNSKGLVTGAVLTGFGAGGFFFNLIGTKLINPDNLKAVKGVFPNQVRACLCIPRMQEESL